MFLKLRELWSKPNIKNIIAITCLLFLSRGLGFLRSILIYNRMDKLSADLLLASTKIPETISSLLIMGTIISSMLPVASKLEYDDPSDEKVSIYINLMMISIILVILIVCIISLVFTPNLLIFTTSENLINEFSSKGLFDGYVMTTRILLIGPVLFSLQAIFGVFLNLKRRFSVYSWAGSIYNIGTILGILIGVRNGYIETSIGMMIGALATVVLFWNEARKYGFKLFTRDLRSGIAKFLYLMNENISEFRADLISTWKVFLPRIFLINGAIMANLLINFVAQNAGQITAFDIGLSIQGLFFSLVTSAGTVFFPDLAKAFNTEIKDNFWNKLSLYGKYIFLTSVFGAIMTILFAPAVMWLFELLGKGQNNAEYIIFIARVCTLSLVFQSLNEILSKYFYVRQRVWQPVIISTMGLVGQILSVYALLLFKSDAGVAVAAGLGIANFIVCIASLYLINIDKNDDTLHKVKIQV